MHLSTLSDIMEWWMGRIIAQCRNSNATVDGRLPALADLVTPNRSVSPEVSGAVTERIAWQQTDVTWWPQAPERRGFAVAANPHGRAGRSGASGPAPCGDGHHTHRARHSHGLAPTACVASYSLSASPGAFLLCFLFCPFPPRHRTRVRAVQEKIKPTQPNFSR